VLDVLPQGDRLGTQVRHPYQRRPAHGPRLGTIGWLHGPMGVANAQRALDYIRILAEFVSQPQYRDVVAMFGIINEPFGPTIGQNNIERLCVSYSACLGDHVC
jgi:hypothetical protein